MNVSLSVTSNRASCFRCQACGLWCAIMLLLPMGVTHAQNYEAVGKRLKAAVEAGELTGAQARAMLGALKNADSDKQERRADEAKDYLLKVRKDLSAAVENGRISKEDANKRFEAAEKAVKEKLAAANTQQESKTVTPEELQQAGIKIRKAIADGTLSVEEGRNKMETMLKMVERRSEALEKKVNRENLEHVGARIRRAVADGTLSAEEGREKMQAMRKMVGEKSDEDKGLRTRMAAGSKDDAKKDATRTPKGRDVDAIRKRIEGAVESGRITREQADKTYIELRKRLAAESKDDAKKDAVRTPRRGAADGLNKRIEGAVKSGKISREEADAKYKEIRKQMAERGDR